MSQKEDIYDKWELIRIISRKKYRVKITKTYTLCLKIKEVVNTNIVTQKVKLK